MASGMACTINLFPLNLFAHQWGQGGQEPRQQLLHALKRTPGLRLLSNLQQPRHNHREGTFKLQSSEVFQVKTNI